MTKELKLGPRLLKIGDKVIGTCDNLTIEIAEATDEEIRELEAAEEIILWRWESWFEAEEVENNSSQPSKAI